MRCPWCNHATAHVPVTIKDKHAFLPSQSSEYEQTLTEAWVDAVTEDDDRTEFMRFTIARCMQCERAFVAKHELSDSDWIPVYPLPATAVPDEVPARIRGLFAEAQCCMSLGAHTGCLLVCRTVLVAIQRERSVSNLKGLLDQGLISATLYSQADEVRLWANLLGHEDVPGDVSQEDCQQLVAYIEALLNALYVEPAKLARLKEKRKSAKESDTAK